MKPRTKAYGILLKLLLIAVLQFISPPTVFSFNDTGPEAQRASDELNGDGMSGFFINKYGDNVFRPNGYVTREDLVLLLNEYHTVTKNLIEQNRILSDRLSDYAKQDDIEKLKKGSTASESRIERINMGMIQLNTRLEDLAKAYAEMKILIDELEEKTEYQVPAVSRREDSERLWIDDFDTGKLPNLLGGNFGSWEKSPDDNTQFCHVKYTDSEKLGKDGYSIRISYDVDSPNPAYNGIWMKLQNANFAPYRALCISVKGDGRTGYTNRFKLELKNRAKKVAAVMIDNISDKWQEIEIPFTNMRGIMDYSNMSELVIIFEDAAANSKRGILYIDNIYCK
ncbi:MAG: carbohydrate binding domain-containing protein [Elusimicrobiota bacterium]